MRILFAIHAVRDPKTAVFMNVCRRADHLRHLGHTVDVVAPQDVGVPGDARAWPLLYGPVLALRGRLGTYDLVVFHSHCGWAFSLLKPLVARFRRTASITAFHGLEPLYHAAQQRELASAGKRYSAGFRLLHVGVLPFLTRMSCRRSDAVFCLNTAEREYLTRNGWSEASRTVVVRNGVEHELFAARRHRGCATALLFVGQWLRTKGIRYLVEAFAAVAARDPLVRLVCAGTRRPAQEVAADFEPGIRSRVTVHPVVDRAALGELLRAADVFVFPSLSEGSSGALLEAMASSLAVVASPAGAAADMLRDGVSALVVPYADAAALAGALERVIADGELRDRLGSAAYAASLEYEWTRANAHYSAHLLAAAQHDRGGTGSRSLTTSSRPAPDHSQSV